MARRYTAGQQVAAGLCVAVLGLLLVAGMLGFGVALFGGLAMLLTNIVLPLFDLHYELTYTQAGGVGLGIIIVRAIFGGLFQVTVKK